MNNPTIKLGDRMILNAAFLVSRDAEEALAQPTVRESMKAQGLSTVLMKPTEFGAHIKAETATWARIIRARNITAE